MHDYIQSIRQKIGHDLFIHPGARIIIENEKNEILVIEKTDKGRLGLPAGAFEFGETIEECIKREVLEETGLIVEEVTLIGVSTSPSNEHVFYPNGDEVQYFTIEFYSNRWHGTLQPQDTAEIKSVSFRSSDCIQLLSKNEQSTFISLEHFRNTGTVRLA